MKELPIRKFTSVVGYLTEAVTITSNGRPIGTYTPTDSAAIEVIHLPKEATVEDVKKAIETDRVSREPRGRLTKGLGDLPGEPPSRPVDEVLPYQRIFSPAPKPKK